MKQKLRTLAFVLALLRTRLDFVHSAMEEDGKLETHGHISTEITHIAAPQSLMGMSLEHFPCDTLKEPSFHCHQYDLLCLSPSVTAALHSWLVYLPPASLPFAMFKVL